jgi:hypothetical protein
VFHKFWKIFHHLLLTVAKYIDLNKKAQRLAAQPLGRFRYLVTILTGFLKSHFGVLSLSLGQVGCSRGLGGDKFITY